MRKATLASILRKSRPGVRLNEHLEHPEGVVVFQHACKMGSKASSPSGWARATDRAFARLAQVQEPGRARGEAGGGGGLAMINKQGQKLGTQRGNRQALPL